MWCSDTFLRALLCPHSYRGHSAQGLHRKLSLVCCLHSINAEGSKEGGWEELPGAGGWAGVL